MEFLNRVPSLLIQQKKEWGEILTGFEQRNRYLITNEQGESLGAAAEVKGSTLLRLFLKGSRPFEIHILDLQGQVLLKLKRPFRWIHHEVFIYNPQDRLLGSIYKRFVLFRRLYEVRNTQGATLYEIHGPLLKPWTFEVKKSDQICGKITKRWGGLLKEAFTDSDKFGIQFPDRCEANEKAVLLGAVFLIDFIHFENKK
ncbi:MAG: scramblase [Deltaproteobacteria bacterium]|nr:scramblase [Deltaproteobacteria bacterium]